MSKWIEVESHEDLPEGVWLVEVEKRHWASKRTLYHVADVSENMALIGSHFSWDMPRVVRYTELPDKN